MYISPNRQNQPMSPSFGIIIGLIFFAIAAITFYLIFEGLKTGVVFKISKYNPEYISKHDQSGRFWDVCISYSIFALLELIVSAWFFTLALRKMRQ
jgi:hypothetical protein